MRYYSCGTALKGGGGVDNNEADDGEDLQYCLVLLEQAGNGEREAMH
jgi:hypothetical protein